MNLFLFNYDKYVNGPLFSFSPLLCVIFYLSSKAYKKCKSGRGEYSGYDPYLLYGPSLNFNNP